MLGAVAPPLRISRIRPVSAALSGEGGYGRAVDANDPLIPPPDDTAFEPVMPGEDPIEAGARRVSDYFNMAAMAWPARDATGQLVPPPPEHVLDSLARSYDLVEEEQAQVRPAAGTVTVIPQLPVCDFCGGQNARYDGHLKSGDQSIAGMACSDCYGRAGLESLGATGDVYLMTKADVPKEVRAVCDELTARLGRPSLWA